MIKGWIWKRCKTGEEATATVAWVAWVALTPVCCSVCLGEEVAAEEEGEEAFQVA